MKCLVTGAAGFIGSHLCERLHRDGHEVLGLDSLAVGRKENLKSLFDKSGNAKKGFNFYQTNVESLLFQYHTVDWMFHLGALADIIPSIDDPVKYHNANVTGTIAALECARKSNVRKFIYTASSSCYGIPTIYPTPETAPCDPRYPYALTKYLGEQYVHHYQKTFGVPTVSLRLFNVFGPRARTSGSYGAVFGVFLAQLARGAPLTRVGDGAQRRDFTYVSDVVESLVRAAESDRQGECYNVGSDNPRSVNELIALISQDREVTVETLPKRPGEPDITFADTTKIRRDLKWSPRVSFEAGVHELLQHVDDYKDAPLWTKDSIAKATESWFKHLK